MKPASRDGSYHPVVSPSATRGCGGGPPTCPFGSFPPRLRPRWRRPRRPKRPSRPSRPSRRCSNCGRDAPFESGLPGSAGVAGGATSTDGTGAGGNSTGASTGGAGGAAGASITAELSGAAVSRYGSGSEVVVLGAVFPRGRAGRPRRRGRSFSLMRLWVVLNRYDRNPIRGCAARPYWE